MTGRWTDRSFGSAERAPAKARNAPRSLGAALREAGLGDAAPAPRAPDDILDDVETLPLRSYGSRLSSAIAAARSPRLAAFAEPDTEPEPEPPEPIVTPTPTTTHGVVSPPPWLRAARRGRRRERLMNTFGWTVTLIVVGSIVGLAGRYLVVLPTAMQASVQARQ